ncbi:hypothetical protein GGH94_004406 [Coemansia aciculifera]|uniref:FHF complex subunit HOOK-interacting protein C-terminal domain-containing protein n=1 Tax=Coemansia aciculifera TaxID=417176 RepID=A0A9W8IFB6_9FUNG|nr:hypothetical protein GGH94_004406 [Coemansia aciculifera]KAJ2871967.1 hypothetical protein GGH93_004399 [Coemansia aciculifera]
MYGNHNGGLPFLSPKQTRNNVPGQPQHFHQARSAAAEVLGRMRTLVDNVAVALDGPPPTLKDKLLENWTRIQEYYTPQRQDDLRKLKITDTTIPHHLECMLKILAQEILDTPQALEPLEFGPCVEYLLQYHVLSDLVDFADVDQPRGMRKYALRFFGVLVNVIPLGLLPESAIRLPLVAIMRQCLHVVQTSPTTPINPLRRQEPLSQASGAADSACRLGMGYHNMQNDRTAVILAHDLLHLIVVLFGRLREHANMAYLFFDWGSEWQAVRASDLAVASLRSATSGYLQQSARGHELFIVHIIVEYLLAPGVTGQLAREALVLVVQVLLAPSDKARYVSFLLDQARVVELLVEHMGYLHSQIPVFRPMPRSPTAQLFSPGYAGPRLQLPLQRRLFPTQSLEPLGIEPRLRSLLSAESVLRSAVQQDRRESAILASARLILEHVDAFFLCWELLDEVAFVAGADERVAAAVQTQLISGFLRTHVEPALLANMQSRSQAITTVSYLTDLITVTHSTRVLDALFTVLLGSELGPERPPEAVRQSNTDIPPPPPRFSLLSKEDQELLDSIEDDALRAEAALLLLPPGTDLADIPGLLTSNQTLNPADTSSDSCPLRTLLIGWMSINDDDRSHLALNTLRLFDTILSTLNQFAYTSLVLRNFTDDASEDTAGFYATGPALGLGTSVAADQELVRAVIERFLDAAPSNVANAMPEVVVTSAMRLDNEESIAPPSLPLPPRNFQAMCSQIMRDNHGCDEYVDDCLSRVRASRHYISCCWQSKHFFSQSSAMDTSSVDDRLAEFYPGAFLTSLVAQFGVVVKRHMAYNLMLTSMVNKLACIADPALTSYLFLANGATMPLSDAPQCAMLYDALVAASADAYVKSERVPRFAARLARQRYEGVETAIKVGAAHPMSNESRAQKTKAPLVAPKLSLPDARISPAKSLTSAASLSPQQSLRSIPGNSPPVLTSSSAMDVDSPAAVNEPTGNSREDVARAVKFLGTPIKRFVHGYIVLDEFAKEMAATALALHTLELDHAMDRQLPLPTDLAFHEEYADLLEYFDPEEPAYRRAAAVQQSLRESREAVINLGTAETPVHNEHVPVPPHRPSRPRRRSSGARSKHNGRRRSSHASNTSNNAE